MDPEEKEFKDLEEEEATTAEPVEETETPVEQEEKRYVSFNQVEESGIIDTETNTVIGTDMFVIQAKILNEIDEIKKSTG